MFHAAVAFLAWIPLQVLGVSEQQHQKDTSFCTARNIWLMFVSCALLHRPPTTWGFEVLSRKVVNSSNFYNTTYIQLIRTFQGWLENLLRDL